MTGQTRATMADWLALHGLTAGLCREILAEAPPPPAALPTDPGIAGDASALWGRIAMVLTAALPDGATVIGQTLALTRTDFASPQGRSPRAFTLHDDGTGRPFVRCAYDGRLQDFLALAHEFGHACQIRACATTPGTLPVAMPPVLRELCAYLSEILLISHLKSAEPDLWPPAQALFDARMARNLDQPLRSLLKALDNASTPYSYSWNYPLARILALRAAAQLSRHQIWQVFRGATSLVDLTALLRA
jgi:hypothetical protein